MKTHLFDYRGRTYRIESTENTVHKYVIVFGTQSYQPFNDMVCTVLYGYAHRESTITWWVDENEYTEQVISGSIADDPDRLIREALDRFIEAYNC